MKPYPCGCSPDELTHCDVHSPWDCHPSDAMRRAEPECPLCKLARLRSVNLDSSATPTRGQR